MVLELLSQLIIWDKPAQIIWPPGYYILRDRIPFFLTILYLYRDRLPRKARDVLGQTLIIFTIILTGVALGFYIKFDNMDILAGIKWSAPSPIEWGSLIALGSLTLSLREIEPFTAYYLSFIAAMGGGWLYECPGWIIGGFWLMAFFKINAIKVFFIEFQLFCLPILLYIVSKTKRYEQHFLMVPLIVLAVAFYALSPWLKIVLPPYIGYYGYRWIVRLPIISMLYTFLYGVKGEKT